MHLISKGLFAMPVCGAFDGRRPAGAAENGALIPNQENRWTTCCRGYSPGRPGEEAIPWKGKP